MKSDKINNSDKILRKYIDLDDDTIESLKRHYKLEDLASDDLLKYVKGNRKTALTTLKYPRFKMNIWLTYRINVDLDDKELQPEDVRRVANYLGEALETMGHSYTLECSQRRDKDHERPSKSQGR